MSTVSSPRPPTLGEVSSATQGEELSDLPIADVADWGHLLPETPSEAAAPTDASPSPETGDVHSEARSEEPAPPPSVEPPPLEVARPIAVASPIAVVNFPATRPPLGVGTQRPGPAAAPSSEELTPPPASVMVDPAQITSLRSSEPLPGVNTPPPGTPLPVLLLVEQAQNASGEERQELSRRINRWLDQMVREGGSRHVADWFHHLLESGRLEGLADAAGHGCHETAVRGLLAMGFPYALEIRPEDLERIKPREEQHKHKKRARNLKGAAAGVLVGGGVVELALSVLSGNDGTGLLTVEVGVALLAMLAVLGGTPRSTLRNMGLAVLLVTSVLSVSLGLLSGYGGLVAGLTGLVATLLFALHRS